MMRFVLCWLLLRPLVKRNYRLRAEGKLPDEMYWADRLMFRLGGSRAYELYDGL